MLEVKNPQLFCFEDFAQIDVGKMCRGNLNSGSLVFSLAEGGRTKGEPIWPIQAPPGMLQLRPSPPLLAPSFLQVVASKGLGIPRFYRKETSWPPIP